MAETLNPEQRRVVDAREPHIVVAAGAGSGKTRVIVQRYLKLIEQGLSADEIVAVTFTKRAAADLKLKVVSALKERGLKQEARKAETGPIQTIHSFYERLLRENAVWAGINPEFQILEDYDLHRLKESSTREALTDPAALDPLVQTYLQRFAGASAWRNFELDARLIDQVQSLLGAAKEAGWNQEKFADAFPDARSIEYAWATRYRKDWPFGPDSFGDKIVATTPGEHPKTAVQIDQEVDLLLGLIRLTVITWKKLDEKMDAYNAYDFHFLQTEACRLIEDNPDLRERMRRQYRAILLDEAQDSDTTQFQFFKRLSPEFHLMVGDGQQAIYGFRGGDRETFESEAAEAMPLTANYRSRAGILNFVNAVFAQKWKVEYRPMTVGLAEESEDFSGVEILQTSNKTVGTDVSNLIRRMIDDGTSPGSIAVLVNQGSEAENVAARLEIRGVKYQNHNNVKSIFSRMEARDMANLLLACVNPREDFALACVLRSPYVDVSLDAIVELSQQPHIYSRLPDFEFVDPEDRAKIDRFLSWFEELRAFCDRFSAHEIINRALNHSPYLPNVAGKVGGVRTVANTRKLLAIATKMPELSPLQLADRFRHLQNLPDKTPLAQLYERDEDAVQIMTIHKSKGLEFENVVVVGTGLTEPQARGNVFTDFRNGVIMSNMCGDNVAAGEVIRSTELKLVGERWRQLYVAMTRAKERLIITYDVESKQQTITDRAINSVMTPGHGIKIHKSQR